MHFNYIGAGSILKCSKCTVSIVSTISLLGAKQTCSIQVSGTQVHYSQLGKAQPTLPGALKY